MAFSQGQLDKLINLLATEIPIGLLLDLRDPHVPLQIDDWRKQGIGDPDGWRLALARLVVGSYQSVNAVPRLATSLYRKLFRDPLLAPQLLPYTVDPARLDAQQEAALTFRVQTMSFKASRVFWGEAAPRICAVVVDHFGNKELGTGFLVAPDLIVTAYHTVAHLIDNGKPNALEADKQVVFDFYEGLQIPGQPRDLSERWVSFDNDWLVDSSPNVIGDGTIARPNKKQVEAFKSGLDFALIRLAEKVGLESATENGGKRRSWFELPDDFPGLEPGQRISIPQHVKGLPQGIDFGFYVEDCPSGTRMRSDIETGPGTSGAPCFAISGTTFPLVAMHNAKFAPKDAGQAKEYPAVLNQAIHFEPIAKRIRTHLNNNPPPDPPAPFWSTTAGAGTPTPILGRKRLIGWINAAAEGSPSSIIFAAHGAGKKIGRSFSIEILRAVVRDRGDRVVELGTRGNAMPETVRDLVQAIFDQLALPLALIDDMPPRPDLRRTDEPDKLVRWITVDVPRWMIGRLNEARQRDSAAAPAAPPAGFGGTGIVQPKSVEDSGPATRWERTWVAIRVDDPGQLRGEVTEFLAALGKLPSEDPELEDQAPLRWLYLGSPPDFVQSIANDWLEPLNPAEIGVDEIIDTTQAIATTFGKALADGNAAAFRMLAEAVVEKPEFANAETRLEALQDLMKRLVPKVRGTLQ